MLFIFGQYFLLAFIVIYATSKASYYIDELDKKFRPCVGAMIINSNSKVWLGKRISKTNYQSENLWQMPQGGVDKNEDYLAAAYRELEEETSIKNIDLVKEDESILFLTSMRDKDLKDQNIRSLEGYESNIFVMPFNLVYRKGSSIFSIF